MAAISALSGKLAFRMNSGEIKDGKPRYRNLTLSGIKSESSANDLAAAAGAVKGLVEFPVERTTFARVELLTD